eukprot:1828624-Amphidinium_carterae.1
MKKNAHSIANTSLEVPLESLLTVVLITSPVRWNHVETARDSIEPCTVDVAPKSISDLKSEAGKPSSVFSTPLASHALVASHNVVEQLRLRTSAPSSCDMHVRVVRPGHIHGVPVVRNPEALAVS